MIRRPPRSTLDRSSAASDVYKRQGKLGDGSSPDDGIYVLMKEVIDNCIDEHTMGYGRHVDVSISGKNISVRDYGRGIPLGKVVDVVSKINTGAKYDSK